jgi:exopolysaccharide biosynthesis polyprenyl glycosylphosphotransferase
MKVFDLSLTVFAFALTAKIVDASPQGLSFAEFLSMKVKLWNFIIFTGMLFAWNFIFSLSGLYESKRLSTRRSEVMDAVKATALVTILLGACAALLNLRMISVPFLVLFWSLCSGILIGCRLIVRHSLRMLRRRGRNLHHILILGTNSRAIDFANRIAAKPEFGYRLVGFVDDQWPGTQDFLKTGFNLCCNFAELTDYLRHNVIDEVAIYLPLRSLYSNASQLAGLFEQHGIIMRLDSDVFNFKIAKARTDVFDGDSQITARGGGPDGWAVFSKRSLDLVVASVLLFLLSPIFLITALLIKLNSKGPIFFGQKRVGLNKRQFVMYKFRTMVPDAEKMQEQLVHLNEMTGPVFKIKNDPRITRIGRILRKTSIDELPQLLNVLIGDMSLVGPRAMSVRDYQFFNEDWQRRRFSVRPGITCLWQITGRNSISFEQWMELDMEYIDRWSLWLDLKILVQTIPAVLKGSGAA